MIWTVRGRVDSCISGIFTMCRSVFLHGEHKITIVRTEIPYFHEKEAFISFFQLYIFS